MGSIGEPAKQSSSIHLPIFNVSDTSPENGRRIVNAAVEYGFLYISPDGTPFTESLAASQFELSKKIFACPLPEKQKYHVGTDNRGWLGMHNEILDPAHNSKEFKEAFNIGEFDKDGKPQQKMPPVLSTSEALDQLTTFASACKKTCNMVLDLLGLGLEIEDGNDWFSKRHGQPSGCVTRLLHYPALPATTTYSPESDVRAGAHSDYGSITLLFQRPSQPGLEIRPPQSSTTTTSSSNNNNNTWCPVPVFPPNYPSTTFPPILVNIGDLMSYWTNGLLRSTVHRVIFPKDTKASEDRYSVVYFCHPSDEEELVAVPSEVVRRYKEERLGRGEEVEAEADTDMVVGYGGGAEGRRALTAREHLMKRLGATYTHRVEREEQ